MTLCMLRLDDFLPFRGKCNNFVNLLLFTLIGTYKWESHPEFGEELDNLTSNRWNPKQPNGGRSVDCVVFQKDPNNPGTRAFNDKACTQNYKFICEMRSCKYSVSLKDVLPGP